MRGSDMRDNIIFWSLNTNKVVDDFLSFFLVISYLVGGSKLFIVDLLASL